MQSVSFVVMASTGNYDCPLAVFRGRKRDKRRSLSQVAIDKSEAMKYARAIGFRCVAKAIEQIFGVEINEDDVTSIWVAKFGADGKFQGRDVARWIEREGFGDGLEAAKILRNYYR